MIVELLLIGKLLDSKTVGSKSTPTAVSPSKLFGRNGNTATPGGRIPKPPTKKGPGLALKKYF